MAEDKEVLRSVWEGKIPVCFTLALEDVQSIEPEPYYVMIPRMTYLPLVTDKMYKHFANYINSTHGEMWLEYEDQPLKWHYPVGVLYDLHAGESSSLPWNITVHFSEFPDSELIHCHNRDTVESHYMSTVKEADSLKHRAQVINNMQKKDHKQLWMGVVNNRFDQFWAVNKKLMERVSDHEGFKYIPFRIYQPDRVYIQKLIKPQCDEGQVRTFRDLLLSTCPECVSEEDGGERSVLVQGIKVPLDTPLQWMSEHLSYPDNFLHVTVVSGRQGRGRGEGEAG